MHPIPPHEIRTPPPRFRGDPGIWRRASAVLAHALTNALAPVLGARPPPGAPGHRIFRRQSESIVYDSPEMQIGLFIIGFFYLAISIGAIYGLFSRRDQGPKRR